MNEPTIAGTTMQPEPELHKKALDPKGVLQKNMKPVMYLGAAALVILAAVLSAHTKPTSAEHAAMQHQPLQPTVQDNTDNNIQDLKNQLAAERQKEADQAAAQQSERGTATAAPGGYGPQQNPSAITGGQQQSSLIQPRAAGDSPASATAQASIKRGPEVNIDSAAGQPYVVYEGTTVDTVLMNR